MTSSMRARRGPDHRPWLLACALLACAAEPVETPPPDAGTPCDGGLVGPLGTCMAAPDAGEALDAGPACAPPEGACRSGRECCTTGFCLAPGESLPCGMCQRLEDECGDESPCPDDGICVLEPSPPCACEPRDVRRCRADCRTAGCADDERCRTDGACEPVPCDDGFACAPGQECLPGRGDAHGCELLRCERDTGCPREAPFCVSGACHASLGTCSFMPP